jgi:hypothetical protein
MGSIRPPLTMPLKLSFSAVIAELGYHIMRAGMMARSTCVSSAGSSREKEEEKAKKKKKSRSIFHTLLCVYRCDSDSWRVFISIRFRPKSNLYTENSYIYSQPFIFLLFFSLSLLSHRCRMVYVPARCSIF